MILLYCLTSVRLLAQIYVPNGGPLTSTNNNIGVGASSSPISKLEIKHGEDYFQNHTFNHPFSIRNEASYINMGVSDQSISHRFGYIQGYDLSAATPSSLSFNPNGGHVGVGTISPAQKFVVSNSGAEGFEVYLNEPAGIVGLQSANRITGFYTPLRFDASSFSFNYGNFGIGTTNPLQNFVVSNNGAEGFEIYLNQPTGSGIVGLQSFDRNSWTYTPLQFEASSFVFKGGGVFVGNVKPTGPFADATLAVDGKIVAKQLQIQVSSWADKVFSKDYKLMPLKEVEAFVIKYHHLPEIPAEKEILLSGLDMGKLQLLQMQKIEELTLYIIAQEKKIEALQTDLGNIKESLPKTKVNAPIKIGVQ